MDLALVNRKRVLRIMGAHGLTLERSTGRREGRVHDGKVAVMRSNLRWCSDALEFLCWNGEKVRIAFVIDAFDREIIAFVAISGAGISGSDVRDMMLEAVETRFGCRPCSAPDRASVGQRQLLHRERDPQLRGRTQPRTLLHAGPVTGKQRYERGVRQNPEARLTSASRRYPTRKPLLGSSPDGSKTTTRSILTPRSACARPSSSAQRSTPSRTVR